MRVTVKLSNGLIISKDLSLDKAIVGRSVKADVVVPDEALSRNHCLIEIEAGNFYVTDLGSSNGVFINSQRIPPDTRTLYNSFSHLTIGELECTIEDVESVESIKEPLNKSVLPKEDNNTKTVTRIALKSPQKRLKPIREKKTSALNANGIIGIMIVMALIYYQFWVPKKSKDEVSETQNKQSPKPETIQPIKKVIFDEFRTNSEYESLNSKKNCTIKPELCINLKLDPNLHEGIIFEDEEIFVFVNPTKKAGDQKYAILKDSNDLLDLVALESILSSEILNQYTLKRIGQIHLIINSPEGIPIKVYRLNPKKFIPGEAPRINIIMALAKALQDGNCDKFWAMIKPLIYFKILEIK
jgi:hypothetical protein